MNLQDLQAWAQSQSHPTATPAVRPEVGVSVLQVVDELERLQTYVEELEAKLATVGQKAS